MAVAIRTGVVAPSMLWIDRRREDPERRRRPPAARRAARASTGADRPRIDALGHHAPDPAEEQDENSTTVERVDRVAEEDAEPLEL